MAKIEELFKRFSEECLRNRIIGTATTDISGLASKLPVDVDLIQFDEEGLLFRGLFAGRPQTVRIKPSCKVDRFAMEPYPSVCGVFQLASYEATSRQISINYLPCGHGKCFEEPINIGFNPNYIASRGAMDISKLPDQLQRAFVFESELGKYILEEVYPDNADNKTLHGLKFAADLIIKDQKYILNKSRKKHIGDFDDFCRYRLVRYPDIVFVEESKAKAVLERILDKTTQGQALLSIWEEYTDKEVEKAKNLAASIGKIKYSDGMDLSDHIKRIMLKLTEQQTAVFKEYENDFKNASLQKPGADQKDDRYKIKDVRRRYNAYYAEVVDENDTLKANGTLEMSITGDLFVQKRRMRAYQLLKEGRGNLVIRNLQFAIEDEAANMIDIQRHHKAPVTERTRKFLKKRFGISDLTANQKKAVEIALNTPDIAIIQGPPGTGKSTVIAAICDRLFEEAEKEARRNRKEIDSSKLILASAFQNDTVEHIASKIEDKGLPTVKIGKDTSTVSAEQIVIDNMKDAIADSLQRYAPQTSAVRVSNKVQNIKSLYVKERNLENFKKSVSSILGSMDLSDELWSEWRAISSHIGSRNVSRDDKRVNALRNLSTDETSYNDSGYKEVMKLLRVGIEFTESEKEKLQNAPVESPPQEFLNFLSLLKKTYLDKLEVSSEAASVGSNEAVIGWLDAVVSFLKERERTSYEDTDTFITANLEAILEELNGESGYIRDSILAYAQSVAATNQKAGSKDVLTPFRNVILEEAARSNPLDLLIPMSKATERIILVGDQKQLPQLVENDIVEMAVEKFDDTAERELMRKKYESSLFGILYNNLQKADKIRHIRLNEQFRMHPAIGGFISSMYYDNELKSGMPDQESEKKHTLTVDGLKDKVMVFCDVKKTKGLESRGIGKSRESEARRVISLVSDIMKDPGSKPLSIGVITFYAAQRDLLFKEAESEGFARRLPDGDYEIEDAYKSTDDGREKLRIGTVDSFQGKEFDVVILSTTRSNTIERVDSNVRKIFGFLTSENRLNVAFSRAQRLLIVCGDGEMFNDEFAQAHVKGLYEFYVNKTTDRNYGARII